MHRLATVALTLSCLLVAMPSVWAATVNVASLDELKTAIAKANPGDRIVVADGTYTTSDAITIAQAGTEQHPIVIEAKTIGGAEITGDASFRLEPPAAYVVVKGFVFTNNSTNDSTELSLRHGHRCRVYGNFMLNSSGLRFFAHDHEIFSNYFEQCRPAIAIGNGGATIPPGPLTSHQRPDRVKVVYNTLVNNRANVQMGGRKNGLGADDLVFANNLIQGGNKAVAIAGPLKDPKWEGNIIWNTEGGAGDIPAEGFTSVDPGLVKDQRGVFRWSAGSAAIGKGAGSYPFVTLDLDKQPRPAEQLDVGADQFSNDAPLNRPLTEAEVGPNAPDEKDRPLISAPKAEWIARR